MEEVENIMSVAPNGNIMDIPEFDIPIMYIDTQLVTKKHVLRNARFMKNSRKVAQGDTSIPVEFDMIISHVEWQ